MSARPCPLCGSSDNIPADYASDLRYITGSNAPYKAQFRMLVSQDETLMAVDFIPATGGGGKSERD